jgi:N-methylhydantoinase B/oxoprolinase/acetone carboxylase alpha subunit
MPDRLTNDRLSELCEHFRHSDYAWDGDTHKALAELLELREEVERLQKQLASEVRHEQCKDEFDRMEAQLRKEVERLRDHVTGLCDWYDHNSANSHQVTAALDALRKLFEEQDDD